MKKVEVITLHRVPNYGSVLQSYATQELIKTLGYSSEIIDYYPKRMTMIAMLKRIKNKNKILNKYILLRNIARLIIIPSYIKRFKVFTKFIKKNLVITKQQYHNNEELKKSIPQADIYCTGSDQTWNSDWNEGIDKALFLDFVPKEKNKIAYAASFGKNKLESWEIVQTKNYLKKYKAISMREKSGVEILKGINIQNAINVLDPTLLLKGDEWRKISNNKYKNEKYILIYNLNRNKKIDIYAKKLSEKTGLKVKYLSYQLHDFYKYGKMYCCPEVSDFLSLIDNAKYVITDSFHAVAFSINFNTEFIVVYPNKFSTRLQSILQVVGLENRVAKDEGDIEIIKNRIDFEKVNEIIEDERNKSIKWFQNALECEENNIIKKYKCIDIEEDKDCCGCRACENICPKNAIVIIENDEGFLYPKVDIEKCINCGMCKKICPMINNVKKDEFLKKSICYGAKSRELNVLQNSSSGGIFYVLSKYVLKHKGLVVGAEMTKEHIVQHIIIDNEKDLRKLMGSKYVSSNTNHVFSNIKDELNKDRLVLFSGLPCQVAGLKNYLIKPYKNLITVDLVCHGVPSQKLFTKYIKFLEEKYKATIVDYKFRSKKASDWGLFSGLISLKKNDIIFEKKINVDFDPYYSNFLKGKNYRESCYSCKFANKKRISDITIADFWGVESYAPDLNNKKGVSIMLINTRKGNDIFDRIKINIDYKKVDIDNVSKYNSQLNHPVKRPKERTMFYYGINEDDFIKKIKVDKNLKNYIKIFIPKKLKLKIKSILRI